MADEDTARYDPFGDDTLRQEIAEFQPRGEGEVKPRPAAEELAALAAARGFDDRSPGRPRVIKEPTKTLQFRLAESEVDAFHQAAYEEFGPKHGAKIALFLKLWRAYQASKA